MPRILLLLCVLAVLAAQETNQRRPGGALQREAGDNHLRGGRVENRKRRYRKVDKKEKVGGGMKRTEERNDRQKKNSKDIKKKNKLNIKKKQSLQGKGKPKGQKKVQKKMKKITRSTCSSNEVNLTCMKNALEGMMFEKNQIANYLKQAKRLTNHGSISTNKVGKKDSFDESRKHLLWAIGGNLSDPKCGPNTTAEKTA